MLLRDFPSVRRVVDDIEPERLAGAIQGFARDVASELGVLDRCSSASSREAAALDLDDETDRQRSWAERGGGDWEPQFRRARAAWAFAYAEGSDVRSLASVVYEGCHAVDETRAAELLRLRVEQP